MKKKLTLLTGIVFLIAILIASGCKPVELLQPTKDKKIVLIYLKDTIKDGKHHLIMYDSNDSKKVVDNLVTEVKDSTQIFWTLANDSGIRSIKRIKQKEKGKILTKTIKGAVFRPTDVLTYRVPGKQTPNDIQGYKIKYQDEENNIWEIDPQLKIPPS